MDDNEALDWGVGDQDDFDDAGENYQQPQNEQAEIDAEDNEDTISLGEDDDDQLLSYRNTLMDTVNSRTNLSQELENRHISSLPKERKEVGANRDNTTRIPAERDNADSYDSRNRHRQDRRDSPPRRRGRRDDRSPRTPQPSVNARVTHALPPKPVGSAVSLPPPSRVLVAEPTTISPRAGGRDLKKQNDSGRLHSVSPASPPNRESRTRSNNSENNQPTTSKPADPTWQHPDSLPPRTNRAPVTDNAHEKDSVQRNRPSAVDPTGLSFEDRHYRPGSDLPHVNTSSRPGERSRPEPIPDRYSRSRHDRADSPPRDRARQRSPPSASDSRGQGYSDRHFVPTSYEPAPQDYRPDSRRRPGQLPDDHADVKSKTETDRPSLRRRESSRGPRDRVPPRQSDMREPPVASLSTSRPRSPPRTRETNHRHEENSGNRERRGWPEDQAPSNYPNRSDRRSPFEQPRSRPMPALPAIYDEYYDRYPDYDPRLDPNLHPQDREPLLARRERPNDLDYSRYPRSQPPPPERSGRHPDDDRRSPQEDKGAPQLLSKTRSPLPPQNISFQSRGKRDPPAPLPNTLNPTLVSNDLPKKPDPISADESRARSGYKEPPTAPDSDRIEQPSSHALLPPIDTRMDVDSKDGPPSSNRSGSRHQSSDERQTGRRSRSPNDRYGPSPLNGPSSARVGADFIPSGPRHREGNRGVDNSRASDRRQPEPQRRREERDPHSRSNDWGRRDNPPHNDLPPTRPRPVTGTNSIPVNQNFRRPPPSGPAGGPSTQALRAAELSLHLVPAPAPTVQAQPVQQVPPPFMNALPPASALLDPSKPLNPPNVVAHQPDNKSLDTPRDQDRAQPALNLPTRPTEPRMQRRTRFDQPTQPSRQAPSQGSVDSQDKYHRATPPPMSREPSMSMKSKSSSERLSDVVEKAPLEERAEIRAPEGSISLIDRFSDDRSRPMERVDRDGPRSRIGEAASPPPAALPVHQSARNFNLPPRPQATLETHPQQTQRSVNGRMDDPQNRNIRMDTVSNKPPGLDDHNFQAPSSKISLLERLSSANNVHESQSLRERIVPSKRDRDEMGGRDRYDGRDASYDLDDGMDPKRQRRRGGGKPRRSNTGGGRR